MEETGFKPQRGKFTLRYYAIKRAVLRAVSNPNGVNLHQIPLRIFSHLSTFQTPTG